MLKKNLKNKGRNRGFTLVEVMIALAVTVIVVGAVVAVVMMVSNVTARQTYQADCEKEIVSVKSLVEEFINTYDVNIFTFESITEHELLVTKGENEFSLAFDDNKNELIASILDYETGIARSKKVELKCITNVKFSASNGAVVCELGFTSYPPRKILVTYGV